MVSLPVTSLQEWKIQTDQNNLIPMQYQTLRMSVVGEAGAAPEEMGSIPKPKPLRDINTQP